MDALDNLRCHFDPIVVLTFRVKTFVPKWNSIDFLNFIIKPQTHDDLSNNNIEARAQSTTGCNACFDIFNIVEDVLAWACLDKLDPLGNFLKSPISGLGTHKRIILHESITWHKSRSTKDTLLNVVTNQGTLKEYIVA